MSMHTGKTELIEPSRFKSAYSTKMRIALTFNENSPYTDQSFKEEADINTIMAKYQSTGELPSLNAQEGRWLDVSEMDFQTHMDTVIEATGLFMALPSHVRDRFQNSPALFLGFCNDESNHKELAKMGLLNAQATISALTDPSRNATGQQAENNQQNSSSNQTTA